MATVERRLIVIGRLLRVSLACVCVSHYVSGLLVIYRAQEWNAFLLYFSIVIMAFAVAAVVTVLREWKQAIGVYMIGAFFGIVIMALQTAVINSKLAECAGASEADFYCTTELRRYGETRPWVVLQLVTCIFGFAIAVYYRHILFRIRRQRSDYTPESNFIMPPATEDDFASPFDAPPVTARRPGGAGVQVT